MADIGGFQVKPNTNPGGMTNDEFRGRMSDAARQQQDNGLTQHSVPGGRATFPLRMGELVGSPIYGSSLEGWETDA